MAERFFQKIANDVLEASEKLTVRLEEGLSAIMSGELPKKKIFEEDQGTASPPEFGDVPDSSGSADSVSYEEELHLLEQDTGGSPLEGIARSVLGDIMDSQIGPQTAMEHFHAFRHAITWTEPFILLLLAFHVIMFTTCMFVSRRDRGLVPRLAVMVLIGVVVRSAEWLNDYGAMHWKSFATQNYFDGRGLFVSIMLCGPLLVYSFLMLVFFLREAAHLLVQVKTAEIKRKRIKKEDSKAKKRRDKKEQ